MLSFDRRSGHSRTIAALDVGTAKVTCVIARPDGAGGLALAGIGQHRSQGIKSGLVTDAEEAVRAARSAIAQAERMAGVTVDEIRLSVAAGRISTVRFVARGKPEAPTVRQADLDRILAGGQAYIRRGGRTLVQLAQADWHLDGAAAVRDPVGMAGHELALHLTAVTADEGPVRNLISVAEKCHVTVSELMAAPVASAMAVTSEEEREVGVLVLDIGAGTTTLALFQDGCLEQAEAIPVGGNHVTFDIARALATSVAEAERIKTLYGTLVKASSDDADIFSYPVMGEEEPVFCQSSKARLAQVIEPRIFALLDLVEERLAAGPLGGDPVGAVVLTGGSSQLIGVETAWTRRFGGHVRVGRPRPLDKMAAGMCSPALSTVLGLATSSGAGEERGGIWLGEGSQAGYLGRVQRWIRESF